MNDAPERFRTEVLSYGDLEETEAFCQRSGLDLAQIRSLRAHPYARPQDPARVVLLRGEHRAAHMGMIPGRLRIAGKEYRVFWGSANWAFDGDPRSRGGAGLLLLISMRVSGNFAGCGPSDFSRPILERAKFDFLRMPRRALLLRSRTFLRRRIDSDLAAASLALGFDPLLRAASRVRRRMVRRDHGFRLEVVPRFDERIAAIDGVARRDLWFPRDHQELNWAIANPWLPPAEYRHLAVYLHRGSRCVGYALARTRLFEGLQLGSILRGAVRPEVPGAAEALIDLLVDAFDDLRMDIADVCTSNQSMLAAAGRLGMMPRRYLDIACKLGPDASAALRHAGKSLADFEADLGEGDVIFA